MSQDKRITIRQAVKQIQQSYDSFELVVKQTLREEFGFDDQHMERFEVKFSELAAQECMRMEAKMRRGVTG